MNHLNLSAHFTLEELTASDTALRKGIDNTPDAEALANLHELALGLERVRALLGHPLYITSGYRGLKLNSAIGSAPTSDHVKGYAADFVCPGYGPPKEICKAIRDSDIDYSQLIFEGTWAHISFAPDMRRSTLTAHFKDGRATYTQGIA